MTRAEALCGAMWMVGRLVKDHGNMTETDLTCLGELICTVADQIREEVENNGTRENVHN